MSDNWRTQERIAQAVAERGYGQSAGQTDASYLVQQIVKAIEEMCEVVGAIQWPTTAPPWAKLAEVLGKEARVVFDRREWGDPTDVDDAVLEEMADVLIPLLVAAHALEADLLGIAEDKATSDVERGLRE